MSNTQPDLFICPGQLFWWQWFGRQVFLEVRNDPRFPRRLHRVVYHLDDFCKAPSEDEARQLFRAQYPDAQEIGMLCAGKVEGVAL